MRRTHELVSSMTARFEQGNVPATGTNANNNPSGSTASSKNQSRLSHAIGLDRNLSIALVIDVQQADSGFPARHQALEDIQRLCRGQKLTLFKVDFDRLRENDNTCINQFYNADVAIVDLSIKSQQASLFFHIGVRENIGMRENIFIYHADAQSARDLEPSSMNANHASQPASVIDSLGYSVGTSDSSSGRRECKVTVSWSPESGSGSSLCSRLKMLLRESCQQSKAQAKEKLKDDLQKAKSLGDAEHRNELERLRQQRLVTGGNTKNDDDMLLSPDILFNFLISYRELQDYDAMIKLVEDVVSIGSDAAKQCTNAPIIRHWYAFALNRRNQGGDRDNALRVVNRLLRDKANISSELLGLCGRIYKDKYKASGYADTAALENARRAYREGFKRDSSMYTGINLASLLVVSGNRFADCSELQSTANVLFNLIGKKGPIAELRDYWDVATYFELCYLVDDFFNACVAAECMFKLNPPPWYIKTTIQNIRMVNDAKNQQLRERLRSEDEGGPGTSTSSSSLANDTRPSLYQQPSILASTSTHALSRYRKNNRPNYSRLRSERDDYIYSLFQWWTEFLIDAANSADYERDAAPTTTAATASSSKQQQPPSGAAAGGGVRRGSGGESVPQSNASSVSQPNKKLWHQPLSVTVSQPLPAAAAAQQPPSMPSLLAAGDAATAAAAAAASAYSTFSQAAVAAAPLSQRTEFPILGFETLVENDGKTQQRYIPGFISVISVENNEGDVTETYNITLRYLPKRVWNVRSSSAAVATSSSSSSSAHRATQKSTATQQQGVAPPKSPKTMQKVGSDALMLSISSRDEMMPDSSGQLYSSMGGASDYMEETDDPNTAVAVDADDDDDSDDDSEENIYEFKPDRIKGVTFVKHDDRCIYLWVNTQEDFQVHFANKAYRTRFHELYRDMMLKSANSNSGSGGGAVPSVGGGGGGWLDDEEDEEIIDYEYVYDARGQKKMLGRGTYGTVYAARLKSTQVLIAIKEIRVSNAQQVQPLHDELKLHSRLRHRNIVHYIGSVYENNEFKIFMEQVPGGSLSALLRGPWGKLKEDGPLRHYCSQILEGLAYLHSSSIAHRDIKGDNVLINTFSGVLKISDFGTSRRLAGLTEFSDSIVGTAQYMAPEVIRRRPRSDLRAADIWSFGCTVVEMATAKAPFHDSREEFAIIFRVGENKEHPKIPDELSDVCREFIESCFKPEPEQRPSAVALLKHEFIYMASAAHRRERHASTRGTPGPSGSRGTPCADSPLASRLTPQQQQQHHLGAGDAASLFNRSASAIAGHVGTTPQQQQQQHQQLLLLQQQQQQQQPQHPHALMMQHSCYAGQMPTNIGAAPFAVSNNSSNEDVNVNNALAHASSATSVLSVTPAMLRKQQQHQRIGPNLSGGTAGYSFEVSPTVTSEATINSPQVQGDEGGNPFFILRKQKERRNTLLDILKERHELLVENLVATLQTRFADKSTGIMTNADIKQLITTVIAILEQPEQKLTHVSQLASRLPDGDRGFSSLNQVRHCLFALSKAINDILRLRTGIKPHWMFNIENLLKDACDEIIKSLPGLLRLPLEDASAADDDADEADGARVVDPQRYFSSFQQHQFIHIERREAADDDGSAMSTDGDASPHQRASPVPQQQPVHAAAASNAAAGGHRLQPPPNASQASSSQVRFAAPNAAIIFPPPNEANNNNSANDTDSRSGISSSGYSQQQQQQQQAAFNPEFVLNQELQQLRGQNLHLVQELVQTERRLNEVMQSSLADKQRMVELAAANRQLVLQLADLQQIIALFLASSAAPPPPPPPPPAPPGAGGGGAGSLSSQVDLSTPP